MLNLYKLQLKQQSLKGHSCFILFSEIGRCPSYLRFYIQTQFILGHSFTHQMFHDFYVKGSTRKVKICTMGYVFGIYFLKTLVPPLCLSHFSLNYPVIMLSLPQGGRGLRNSREIRATLLDFLNSEICSHCGTE